MNRRESLKLVPVIPALCAKTAFGGAGVLHETGVPQKSLSIRYLDTVRDMLSDIRKTQAENILEASHAMARALLAGRTVWYSWDMGHSVEADVFPGRPGVPQFFSVGYDPGNAKRGDVLLSSIWTGVNAYIAGMGFANRDDEPMDFRPADAKEKGTLIIGAPSPWGMDAKGDEEIVYPSARYAIRPSADIWIETGITTLGAVMDIPGAGAPFGPVSGIIGMVTFWMMAADVCRMVAREGMTLPVTPAGQKLTDENADTPSLDAPLMDDYFDTVLRQLEMIGAELGTIRGIARMAVDSVLAGGTVYCYSRDRNALAYESQTRRGGMALTRGLYDENGELSVFGDPFEGTSRDTVIMGIHSPADPVDLRHLDTFRGRGLKIASIGPATRNLEIPEGRTVPKEADLHAGRMCDTEGLYAFPGFKGRVCPTSGACLNQLFWAICMEIMEMMIERTGNVPGVYLTGAVRGGIDHLNRVNAIYEERGY